MSNVSFFQPVWMEMKSLTPSTGEVKMNKREYEYEGISISIARCLMLIQNKTKRTR